MKTDRQLAAQPVVDRGGDAICSQRLPVDRSAQNDRRLADLMRLAQDGDKTAYAKLLGAVTPLLRKVVRQRYSFLQPSDIEDIVQEILLSLHVARATYDPARPFLPWVMAIARNRMVDAARRHTRRSAHEVADERLLETFMDDGANISMSTYGDPEALRQAIRALPRGQRQAVELLKLHELSLKDAADVTGMSTSALKVAMHRAVRTLRMVLSNEA
jgi:RNA polymerase sigma factor (sigma-70 family)